MTSSFHVVSQCTSSRVLYRTPCLTSVLCSPFPPPYLVVLLLVVLFYSRYPTYRLTVSSPPCLHLSRVGFKRGGGLDGLLQAPFSCSLCLPSHTPPLPSSSWRTNVDDGVPNAGPFGIHAIIDTWQPSPVDYFGTGRTMYGSCAHLWHGCTASRWPCSRLRPVLADGCLQGYFARSVPHHKVFLTQS